MGRLRSVVLLALAPSALVASLYADLILGKDEDYTPTPRPTPPTDLHVHVPVSLNGRLIAESLRTRLDGGSW